MRAMLLLTGLIAAMASCVSANDFGSYVVTCNATHMTFQNFGAQNCGGASTTFSSVLNQCALEFISPFHRNFSYNAGCDGAIAWYANYDNLDCAQPPMLPRHYNVGGCYNCPNSECKNAQNAGPSNFATLIQDAAWFENQWNLGGGKLLVTSMSAGTIYEASYNPENCAGQASCAVASMNATVSGYKSVSGITYDAASGIVHAIATKRGSVEENVIVAFAATSPENISEVIPASKTAPYNLFGNLTLNGLAQHPQHKFVFYSTNLGNFSANNGALFVIDVNMVTITLAMDNFTAADGCFVFEDVLYISEVFAARVHLFDVSTVETALRPKYIGSYAAPGMSSLDDFFVYRTLEGEVRIIGADWVGNQILSWVANGTSTAHRTHASGLMHPTSLRPELDADGVWRSDYVTVTQGGNYPVIAPLSNAGALYRLRLKQLPPPVHSAGTLLRLVCPDLKCAAPQCTAFASPIDECFSNHDGTSSRVSCTFFNSTRLTFQGENCLGLSVRQDSIGLLCLPDGTGSSLELCGKL